MYVQRGAYSAPDTRRVAAQRPCIDTWPDRGRRFPPASLTSGAAAVFPPVVSTFNCLLWHGRRRQPDKGTTSRGYDCDTHNEQCLDPFVQKTQDCTEFMRCRARTAQLLGLDVRPAAWAKARGLHRGLRAPRRCRELRRSGLDGGAPAMWERLQRPCTMQSVMSFCRLPGPLTGGRDDNSWASPRTLHCILHATFCWH